MTTLVLGATGATGRLAVQQLLAQGEAVKALVRSRSRVTPWMLELDHLTVVETEISDLSVDDWMVHLQGVTSVVSCLGHNMSFKGVYGHPRRLVTDVVSRIHLAIERLAPVKPVKYVLMNTTGVRNPELNEQHSLGEKVVIGLLSKILPPQSDNESAAHYLRAQVGQQNPYMTWVVVRPDGLVDEQEVTEYVEEPSPVRSPIFDSGKTSRMNVGNFMMRLVLDDNTWSAWQGQSPVLYNQA